MVAVLLKAEAGCWPRGVVKTNCMYEVRMMFRSCLSQKRPRQWTMFTILIMASNAFGGTSAAGRKNTYGVVWINR